MYSEALNIVVIIESVSLNVVRSHRAYINICYDSPGLYDSLY